MQSAWALSHKSRQLVLVHDQLTALPYPYYQAF